MAGSSPTALSRDELQQVKVDGIRLMVNHNGFISQTGFLCSPVKLSSSWTVCSKHSSSKAARTSD